jgi:hypothetical protein
MKRWKIFLFGALTVALAAGAIFHERAGLVLAMAQQRFVKKTVKDRLAEFGAAARQRLAPDFARERLTYPPKNVALVVLKSEKRFEIYAEGGNQMRFIRAYPILAASGRLGPKLREGDHQVPEGIYEIESLNPNSAYHVSLRLNYPNEFDRARARNEGRTALGGDIMIHGKALSIGCVALGDRAAEDVFTLAADSGIGRIKVICAPVDLRTQAAPMGTKLPAWTGELYAQIKSKLASLPSPPK